MSSPSIFSKIIRRELPATFLYEDDLCVVIKDIHPVAPVHLLVIPKKEIPTLADVTEADEALLGHLLLVASKAAREQGLDEKGYRTLINTREYGGQVVYHLHIHVIGGRQLKGMG